jgi:hypothetical protein
MRLRSKNTLHCSHFLVIWNISFWPNSVYHLLAAIDPKRSSVMLHNLYTFSQKLCAKAPFNIR